MKWMVVVTLAGCASAQWDAPASIARPTVAQYPGAAAVILKRELSYREESNFNIERRVERLAILTPDGIAQAKASVTVPPNVTRVFVDGRTVQPDGTVLPAEIVEARGSRRIQFRGVGVGSIVEWVSELEADGWHTFMLNLISGPLPVAKYHVEIFIPRGGKFGFGVYHTKIEPRIDSVDGRTRVSLDLNEVPAAIHARGSNLVEPWWVYRLQSLTNAAGFTRRLMEDWSSAVAEPARTLGMPLGTMTVDAAPCNGETRCVVATALKALHAQFSFAGFVPYQEVYKPTTRAGRANNFDKARILSRALRLLGVPAELVLVGRDRSLAIDPSFPMLNRFDHAIVYVPQIDLFVDPSCEACAVGELPQWSADRKAIVLGETPGIRRALVTARIVDLPAARPDVARSTLETTIGGDGKLAGSWSLSVNGKRAVELATREKPGDIDAQCPTATVDSSTPAICAINGASCDAQRAVTLPAAVVDGKQMTVTLGFFPRWPIHDHGIIEDDSELLSTVTLRPPDGWTFDGPAPPVLLTTPAADLSFSTTFQQRSLVMQLRVLARHGAWQDSDKDKLDGVVRQLDDLAKTALKLHHQ
jgi:hypothetical protein